MDVKVKAYDYFVKCKRENKQIDLWYLAEMLEISVNQARRLYSEWLYSQN